MPFAENMLGGLSNRQPEQNRRLDAEKTVQVFPYLVVLRHGRAAWPTTICCDSWHHVSRSFKKDITSKNRLTPSTPSLALQACQPVHRGHFPDLPRPTTHPRGLSQTYPQPWGTQWSASPASQLRAVRRRNQR